jgi:hypothetical protein
MEKSLDMDNSTDDPQPNGSDKEDWVLGTFTVREFREYAKFVKKYLEVCKSESLRLVVLESWLLVDYTIRELLMAGLRLPKVGQDVLFRQQILRRFNFETCRELVTKIRDINLGLRKPLPQITFPPGFWMYLFQNERNLLDQLESAQRAFRKSKGLPADLHEALREELGIPAGMEFLTVDRRDNSRWVSDDWLDVTKRITKKWKNGADKLNQARNEAAHSHDELAIAKKLVDESAIAKKLVVSESDALKLAKEECREIATELVNVKDWFE